ncbi:MAG: hypothetical protein HZB51_17475 [Chloroflexi bacterium]|nr:hypothetical protein [Chloroflexota bacterium]
MASSDVPEHETNSLRSQSFIVRVWLEELSDGNGEWRGKVQCVASGEALYFRDWENMVTAFQKLLALSQSPQA